MVSEPGWRRIATHILLNISGIIGNQTTTFGQLIEHPKIIFFFKNYAKNEAGKLVYLVKASGLKLGFTMFW